MFVRVLVPKFQQLFSLQCCCRNKKVPAALTSNHLKTLTQWLCRNTSTNEAWLWTTSGVFCCSLCCRASSLILIIIMTKPFHFSAVISFYRHNTILSWQCTGTQMALEIHSVWGSQTSGMLRELEGMETMNHAIAIYSSLHSLGVFCRSGFVFLCFNSPARSSPSTY